MALTKNGDVKRSRAELEAALAVLTRWQEKQATAEASLAVLQAGVGQRALEDEEAATRLPREMADLRDTIEVAAQAVAAALPRVQRGQHDVLSAEAAALDPAVGRARAALRAYENRRDALLDDLKAHTGDLYAAPLPEPYKPVPGQVEQRLQDAVRAAEVPPAIIRAVADGETGLEAARGLPLAQWPAVVASPDAVFPAPYYAESVRETQETAAQEAADIEEMLAKATALVGRFTALNKALDDEPNNYQAPEWRHEISAMRDKASRDFGYWRWQEAPERLQAVQAQLVPFLKPLPENPLP